MRPAPFSALEAYERDVEAEQAVKPKTLDRRACRRRSHHEPPGKRLASQSGGLAPPGPPTTPRMSSFSRESSPLEESDITCGTVVLFRLGDGRLLARRADCKTKACGRCGPRLRAEAAHLWARVMAGQVIYRHEVADAEWSRYQRKLRNAGADYGVIPAADGMRVVYTTAPVGEPVERAVLAHALASDFAAMPSDRRQKRLSTRWLALARELEAELDQAVQQQPAECLGILRRPLEQVAMVAEELDMLIGEAGSSGLYLREPEDAATWHRFCALTRLYRRGRDEAMAA
jgi:hypothetical protein